MLRVGGGVCETSTGLNGSLLCLVEQFKLKVQFFGFLGKKIVTM